MRIVYFAATSIPSPAANSVQVMKMCSALAGLGHEVHLVVPSIDPSSISNKEALFNRYGLKHQFDFHAVPVDPAQKKKKRVAAIKMVQLAKKLNPAFIYGRNLSAALIAASKGFSVFHELHHLPRAEESWTRRVEAIGHKVRFLSVRERTASPEIHELYQVGALGDPHSLFCKLLSYPNLLGVIAITQALKNDLEGRYPQIGGRISVLPDGADPFPENVVPASLKKRAADLEVGYTGHLYPGKGIEIIPDLAARCRWANFHIIGGRDEHVEHWRTKLRAHDNVFLYGAVPPKEVPSFIKSFDVCLLPNRPQLHVYSRKGRQGADIAPYTSPLKMFEYMAAGKAIVASDLNVLKEVLVDGSNALLCKHDDPAAWGAALERLRHDTQIRDQLGAQALREFQGQFEWSSRAGFILKQFEQRNE